MQDTNLSSQSSRKIFDIESIKGSMASVPTQEEIENPDAFKGGVEQDTADSEQIPDLYSYLLPPEEIRNGIRSFGLYFDRNVFEGWVKQPSACCAAASVAGGWNVLANLTRSERENGALHHEDVLDMYREIFLEIISTHKLRRMTFSI